MKGKPGMDDIDLNVGLLFPLEIALEILSRLPVDSLLRFKCVYKSWKEVIHHPEFIEMHRIRSTKPISDYIGKDEDSSVFDLLCVDYGLYVERSKSSGMYRVRNPATKQILALPDPKEQLSNMLIVFLASTSSYKLVYIYQIYKGEIMIGLKVLSFEGSDLSWRAIEGLYKCEFDRKRKRFGFMKVGDFIYFYALSEDGSCNSQIYCLDVGDEVVHGPIIKPHSFPCFWKDADIERWLGKVAFTRIVEEKLHVWVLEDPFWQKWAEEKIIPWIFLKENPMKKGFVPFSASPKEVWFRKGSLKAFVYKTISKEVRRTTLSAHPEIVRAVGSTLVKLKGMKSAGSN